MASDPITEIGNACIDPWVSREGASLAPADNADEHSLGNLASGHHEQWTTAVALARIATTLWIASTEHGCCDVI